MSSRTCLYYLNVALEHVPLYAVASYVTGTNDPIGAGITAATEVMLLPVINSVYQSITKREMPIHIDEVENYAGVPIPEQLRDFVTFCTLNVMVTYISAQVSKKLGYKVNIPQYLIISALAKNGFWLAKRGLCGRVEVLEG